MFHGVPNYILLTIFGGLGVFLIGVGIPSFFPSKERGHTPKAIRKHTWNFVVKKNPLLPLFFWSKRVGDKLVKWLSKRKAKDEAKPKVKLTSPSNQMNVLNGLPVIYAKSCQGYKLGDQEYNNSGQLQYVTFCISKGRDPNTGEEWFALHDAFLDEGAVNAQQGKTNKKGR
jgi:hypothetical protein